MNIAAIANFIFFFSLQRTLIGLKLVYPHTNFLQEKNKSAKINRINKRLIFLLFCSGLVWGYSNGLLLVN